MARMLFDISEERRQQVRVNARNQRGWTPLHMAIARSDFMMTALLMRKGGDPNMVNGEGSSPLHTICAKSHDDYLFATALFDLIKEENRPYQVDIRDLKFGDTPLHVAVRKGHTGMVQLLLTKGANPNLRDHNMRTPLQLAVERASPRLVDLLLDHDIDMFRFVFPTESDFDGRLSRRPEEEREHFQLRLAADLLYVATRLENRGYNLKPSDVATIMKLFVKHDLLNKCDVKVNRYDDSEFKRRAKLITIRDDYDLSLYDLIKMQPEEADKHLTYRDYSNFASSAKLSCIPESHRRTCTRNLCEKLSRGFFRRWALHICTESNNEKLMKIFLTNSNLKADTDQK
uniref:Uncharacterized protein n=1 Tax=Trichogramma kaykai TaxID=54128 RepID=A0ABD2XJU1_9HYME